MVASIKEKTVIGSLGVWRNSSLKLGNQGEEQVKGVITSYLQAG